MKSFFKRCLLGTTLVLALVCTCGAATAGELNVQGGTSTGGSATFICGSTRTGMRFSVTGAYNDTAFVRDRYGNTVACLSIRDLANLPAHRIAPLIRYDVLTINGETRVMLGIAKPSPIFNGGSVTVTRGHTVIDTDPVVVVP